MRFSGIMRVGLAIAFGVMTIGAATAQISSEVQSALRANCRSDAMSKCSGMRGQEALVCLQKNVSSLSPACKAAVSQTLPKPKTEAAPPPPAAAPAPAAPARTVAPAPAPAPVPAQATTTPPTAPAAAAPPPAAPPKATASKPPAKPAAKPVATAKPPAAKPSAPAAPAAAPAEAGGPTPEQMNALKFTCRRDFGRLCKGIAAGGAEALGCLQQNAARLSPNCKTSVADVVESLPAGGMPAAPVAAAAAPPQSAGPVDAAVMVRACKLDLIRYCRNAELGDGRKIACLNEHMANLTVRCRTALKVTAPIR